MYLINELENAINYCIPCTKAARKIANVRQINTRVRYYHYINPPAAYPRGILRYLRNSAISTVSKFFPTGVRRNARNLRISLRHLRGSWYVGKSPASWYVHKCARAQTGQFERVLESVAGCNTHTNGGGEELLQLQFRTGSRNGIRT